MNKYDNWTYLNIVPFQKQSAEATRPPPKQIEASSQAIEQSSAFLSVFNGIFFLLSYESCCQLMLIRVRASDSASRSTSSSPHRSHNSMLRWRRQWERTQGHNSRVSHHLRQVNLRLFLFLFFHKKEKIITVFLNWFWFADFWRAGWFLVSRGTSMPRSKRSDGFDFLVFCFCVLVFSCFCFVKWRKCFLAAG